MKNSNTMTNATNNAVKFPDASEITKPDIRSSCPKGNGRGRPFKPKPKSKK